ncbi:MAG: helix-hairpin-helix domain-containing protein [Promethearchaeia archaeon]
MSFKLEDVKGCGKKTVKNLKKAGIKSVEDLADSNVDELTKIEGIGKASATKFVEEAKLMLGKKPEKEQKSEVEEPTLTEEEEKEIEEQVKKQEEKRKRLEGKEIEQGDFILVKITGKTRRGNVFRVSSEEDAKKVGIYDEQEAKQGQYTPEFVVVGKPGFLNEGLMQTVENMNYFEKKSVRIPPEKAFGKRDPNKIDRIGIAKFRRMNNGKAPEIGQEFTRRTQQGAQRGRVRNIVQGKVLVDYNHPLAGQNVDYNIEILDKIEDFDEKIKYFMQNKGIPPDNIEDFVIKYDEKDKTVEITIPKMYLFQNLTYLKFGLANDLQTYISDQVDDVKYIELYEKMPMPSPQDTEDSVMKKVQEYSEKQEEFDETEEERIEDNLEDK